MSTGCEIIASVDRSEIDNASGSTGTEAGSGGKGGAGGQGGAIGQGGGGGGAGGVGGQGGAGTGGIGGQGGVGGIGGQGGVGGIGGQGGVGGIGGQGGVGGIGGQGGANTGGMSGQGGQGGTNTGGMGGQGGTNIGGMGGQGGFGGQGGTTTSGMGGMGGMGGSPLADDGSACGDDATCAGDRCITETDAGWPSGYCAGDCDIAAPLCAGGGSCVDFGGVGRCLKPCAQPTDCRAGYDCVDPGAGQTFCYPDCTQDAQCPTLGACDLPSGLCTFGGGGGEIDCADLTDNDGDNLTDCEDPTSCQALAVCQPGAGDAGQPCAASSDCKATGGDPVCFPEASLGWPAGSCSEFCAPGVPGGCSGDGVCVTGSPLPGKAVCRDACAVDADCPTAGYRCEDVAPGVKACAPHCTADAQCSTFCNAETGLCTDLDEDCANGIDDDFDQSSDCEDLDCIAGACGQAIQDACVAAEPALASSPGNTTNGTAIFSGTCTGDGAMEHIFTYTPGVAGEVGTLSITLQSATDQGVYVRTACADGATELGCRDTQLGGTDEILSLVVQGGQPLNIFVDGFGAGAAGPFNLDVSFQVATCGDGVLVAPEECDDNNTMGGDGCDATCAIEYGLYCSAALTAQASNMGDTTGGSSVFQGSCTGAGALERVYAYTAATDGTLEIRLMSATDQGFYVRGSCVDAATEVACVEMAGGGGTEYLSLPVTSGQLLYVIVDGFLSPAEAGPYTLTFDLTP